jgi:hypothetical protein
MWYNPQIMARVEEGSKVEPVKPDTRNFYGRRFATLLSQGRDRKTAAKIAADHAFIDYLHTGSNSLEARAKTVRELQQEEHLFRMENDQVYAKRFREAVKKTKPRPLSSSGTNS